jgi:putative Mg2+ transporter-C (MgtC) family protein
MPATDTILRLATAAVLGAVLGIERELRGKAAGLRTNMLIALGSALFTLMSVEIARSAGGDATRIASQIAPGIGFLGAGAIIQGRGSVHGMTTAATIWVNAAIGMAAGSGSYGIAVLATVIALVVLAALDPIDTYLTRRRDRAKTAPEG